MKLFFLGTGSAQGFPSIFGDSPLEQEARRLGGRNLRARSSILVDDRVRVDLPPDALSNVHRYPQLELASLRHLMFTHSHDDHFAIRELQYLAPTFAPERREPLHVYASEMLVERIRTEMDGFFDKPPVLLQAIQPFVPLNVASLNVLPVPSRHKPDETCLNFVFERGGRRLLYATDTGWYHEPTWEALEGLGLDVVVLECGHGIGESAFDGHLSLPQCVRFRDRLAQSGSLAPHGAIYLTHLGPVGGMLHEDLVDAAGRFGLDVAYDGLEIEI